MRKNLKYLIVLLMVLFVIIVFFLWKDIDIGWERWNNENLSYVKADVVKIYEEEIEEQYGSLKLGYQIVELELKSGEYKGEKLKLENNLSTGHSIYVKEGDSVIVLADHPKNVEPYYSIYNYDRSASLIGILVFFLLVLFFVGRKKGILSAFSLLVSLYFILFFLLPQIYKGENAVLITIITCIICGFYSIIIIYGFTKMSLVNLISIGVTFILTAILYYIFSSILNISGYNLEESEGLLLIAQQTGLDVKGILFSSVAISALGASKDVSVSISSALQEIKEVNPKTSKFELLNSGMNIGKDIIGTMVDTLIFAFLGSTFATLLIFISYGVEFYQLINSDFFTEEILTGIIGTSTVILMVPIAALFSSIIYTSNKDKKNKKIKK